MLETKRALSRPLVIAHRCDGRCRYDPIAKQELVQSGLQPGVSIAREAMLTIILVNGVQMRLQAIDLAELSPLLNTLANLRYC